jgi:hypothetical protein
MNESTTAVGRTRPASLTFSQWLAKQVNRGDPIGDAARDDAWARRHMPEARVPSGRIELFDLVEFLDRVDACEGARRAFFDAWEEWMSAFRPR